MFSMDFSDYGATIVSKPTLYLICVMSLCLSKHRLFKWKADKPFKMMQLPLSLPSRRPAAGL